MPSSRRYALLFLASPAASGLSGAAIELNGREVD